ncbi:hypothetical protein BaRGS_00015751, partial [Batillaria attramentaria]
MIITSYEPVRGNTKGESSRIPSGSVADVCDGTSRMSEDGLSQSLFTCRALNLSSKRNYPHKPAQTQHE